MTQTKPHQTVYHSTSHARSEGPGSCDVFAGSSEGEKLGNPRAFSSRENLRPPPTPNPKQKSVYRHAGKHADEKSLRDKMNWQGDRFGSVKDRTTPDLSQRCMVQLHGGYKQPTTTSLDSSTAITILSRHFRWIK